MAGLSNINKETGNTNHPYSLLNWFGAAQVNNSTQNNTQLEKTLANLIASDEVYSLTQVSGALSEHPRPTEANTTFALTFNLHGKEQTITAPNQQALDQQLVQRREIDAWIITDSHNETIYKYRNRYDGVLSAPSQSDIDKKIARDLPRCYYGWVTEDISEKHPHQSFVAKEYNWYWGINRAERFNTNELPHFLQTISSLQQSWRNTKIISGLTGRERCSGRSSPS